MESLCANLVSSFCAFRVSTTFDLPRLGFKFQTDHVIIYAPRIFLHVNCIYSIYELSRIVVQLTTMCHFYRLHGCFHATVILRLSLRNSFCKFL
jgi:hypothetical protein